MITNGPLLPIWVTVPAAFILMIAISSHAASLERSSAPPSRRRIRLANAWLSVLTLGLLLAGFSLIDPATHLGEWMLVWIAAMMMLLLVIGLAMTDVINTVRLAMTSRNAHRRRLSDRHAKASRAPASTTHDTPEARHEYP